MPSVSESPEKVTKGAYNYEAQHDHVAGSHIGPEKAARAFAATNLTLREELSH
jgi:hypothetical protein